jgi:hypothetical protein
MDAIMPNKILYPMKLPTNIKTLTGTEGIYKGSAYEGLLKRTLKCMAGSGSLTSLEETAVHNLD